MSSNNLAEASQDRPILPQHGQPAVELNTQESMLETILGGSSRGPATNHAAGSVGVSLDVRFMHPLMDEVKRPSTPEHPAFVSTASSTSFSCQVSPPPQSSLFPPPRTLNSPAGMASVGGCTSRTEGLKLPAPMPPFASSTIPIPVPSSSASQLTSCMSPPQRHTLPPPQSRTREAQVSSPFQDVDLDSGQEDVWVEREASQQEGATAGWDGEMDDDEEDYVRVSHDMHRGHVEVAVIKKGWLSKQSFYIIDGRYSWKRHFARWKERFFVLGSDGCLRYYLDEAMQKFRRCIPLAGMEATKHFYAAESTDEGARCFILRPKQRPHMRRRSQSSPQGTREEEMKILAKTSADMEGWLACIQEEIEASELQGQTIYRAAWSTLRSFISDTNTCTEDTTGSAADWGDFVHVSDDGEEEGPPLPELGRAKSSKELTESELSFATPTVPIPRMNIVIMVVGTRGDVQPFTVLGKLLQKNGHRVRLATHALYRDNVTSCGLEFYPLGGDPLKLSAYMVKTSGRIFPKLYDHEEMTKDLPEQIAMLNEIINSTWPACTAPDPEDPLQREFIADAIISNPVTYGHVHCAEALSVPLHVMFPQPWSPTKAFPHPLSGLPYHGVWCKENYYSYVLVDKFLWFGIRDLINDFRLNVLGLDPIRLGEHGGDLLNHNKIPFSKMWSPKLVPKPKDWGPHIDVVGNFFDEPVTDTPPGMEELEVWLSKGERPIFIGFGSMVIPDTRSLVSTIAAAAAQTNTRVVIQSGWAVLDGRGLPESIFAIGNCPHDWLLPRMAAVIHHGGAGTVAAGLRAGKPTMVCPFFGDQFFWGQMVFQARVGLQPIPVTQLTVEKLAQAFIELKSPRLEQAAQAMAQMFGREDGAKEGMKAFYRHLPVEDMVCDVSLFTRKPLVARRYCPTCGVRLSFEADAVVHRGDKAHHVTHDYRFVDWGVVGPRDTTEGLVQGITSLTHEFIGSVAGVVKEPVVGASKRGIRGAATGLASGLVDLIRRPIRGGIVFVDKISAGVVVSQQTSRPPSGVDLKRQRYILYDKVLDMQLQLYDLASARGSATDGTHAVLDPLTATKNELLQKRRDEMASKLPGEILSDLVAGHEQAMRCKELFLRISKGDPCCVSKEGVLSLLDDIGGYHFDQTKVLSHELLDRIDSVGAGQISFQQFCVFFKALHQGIELEATTDKPSTETPNGAMLDSWIFDPVFLDKSEAPQLPTVPSPQLSGAAPTATLSGVVEEEAALLDDSGSIGNPQGEVCQGHDAGDASGAATEAPLQQRRQQE